MNPTSRSDYRRRRHLRVRRKIQGTADRPRMAVFRSNKHLYVQFIDDDTANTLAAVSTRTGPLKGQSPTVENAKKLGEAAAEAAMAQGIEEVVFDRGGFRYAGKIQALADAARDAGLKI